MLKFRKILLWALGFALLLPIFVWTACRAEKGCNAYSITLSFDGEKTLTGREEIAYRNRTGNALSVLKFHLYPNAYREGAEIEPVSSVYRSSAYYAGDSFGEMRIDAVENCASFEVGGADCNLLTVALREELFPDEEVKISIDYTLTLAQVNHRTGITEKTVNLGNFYPVLCVYEEGKGFYECTYVSTGDPFYSECADYTVSLTVPADYTAAASAKGKESVKDGKKTYIYNMEDTRDFALCLSKEFLLAERTVGGVAVRYYYLDDAEAQETLDTAAKALAYFSDTFGGYIYDSYTLVQTGFCYGGMEYPALSMLSSSLEREDYLYTVVHETAHQWWYAMVGNNQFEYAWMDEGLAEYSCAMFFDSHADYGVSKEDLVKRALASYRAYYTIYNQIFGESDTSMSRPLDSFVSEYEYVNLTYHKGTVLLETLRQAIGDERFLSGLKEYYSAFLQKIAEPSDMVACFRKTGIDVAGLFEGFVGGKTVI